MFGLIGKLIVGLIFTFIAYALAPKPKPPAAATLEDFDIPKADEGDAIGKVFGTVLIRNATVHWYGDLKTEAIKEKSGKK